MRPDRSRIATLDIFRIEDARRDDILILAVIVFQQVDDQPRGRLHNANFWQNRQFQRNDRFESAGTQIDKPQAFHKRIIESYLVGPAAVDGVRQFDLQLLRQIDGADRIGGNRRHIQHNAEHIIG